MVTEWLIFGFIIAIALVLDLGVFHKSTRVIPLKEAAIWSVVWIVLSLLFALGIWHYNSPEEGILFLTGYVVEKSLSVDNLFLFVVIFRHFSIAKEFHHKILFWGIIGAIVTRAIIILAGISLIQQFDWVTYLFGLFIVYIGIKTAFADEEDFDISETRYFKILQRYFPIQWNYAGDKFIIKEAGKVFITPLLVVLIVVEISDILFALDSVPAILSITTDTFLVYTSNLFAILGLRSLYFVLAEMVDKFYYLSHGVSVILILVGVKILAKDLFHLPEGMMLGLIILVLAASIAASFVRNKKGLS